MSRVADLMLRGSTGAPTPVRVRWPHTTAPDPAPPVVVLLPDAAHAEGVDRADDELGRELCSRVGAVVLCTPWAPRREGALDRAEAVLAWAADHGAELGADPDRLVVAGRGAGAAAAAALALRARDRGWPRIRRQVLVVDKPGSCRAGRDRPGAGGRGKPAPVILVAQGASDCAARLRATGADVEELRFADEGARAVLAEPLLAELVRSLRDALRERGR